MLQQPIRLSIVMFDLAFTTSQWVQVLEICPPATKEIKRSRHLQEYKHNRDRRNLLTPATVEAALPALNIQDKLQARLSALTPPPLPISSSRLRSQPHDFRDLVCRAPRVAGGRSYVSVRGALGYERKLTIESHSPSGIVISIAGGRGSSVFQIWTAMPSPRLNIHPSRQ